MTDIAILVVIGLLVAPLAYVYARAVREWWTDTEREIGGRVTPAEGIGLVSRMDRGKGCPDSRSVSALRLLGSPPHPLPQPAMGGGEPNSTDGWCWCWAKDGPYCEDCRKEME